MLGGFFKIFLRPLFGLPTPVANVVIALSIFFRWQELQNIANLVTLSVLGREGAQCKLCDTALFFIMKEARVQKLKGGIDCSTVCFGMRDCLKNRKLYYRDDSTASRFWMDKSLEQAAAYASYETKQITLRPGFFEQTEQRRQTILLHECTHLTFSALDIAYVFQPTFPRLRGVDALHNADTVATYLAAVLDPTIADLSTPYIPRRRITRVILPTND